MRGLLMTAEKKGWKPWDDTLAYFPLDSKYQLNSYDGTKTLTANGRYYHFEDNCVVFAYSKQWNDTSLSYQFTWITTYTIYWWFENKWQVRTADQTSSNIWYGRLIYRNWADVNYVRESWSSWIETYYHITSWWHSFAMSCTSSTTNIYIDGVLVWSPVSTDFSQRYLIIYWYTWWKLSKIWLSNIQWWVNEALSFYEWTKRDYWIS